MGLPRYRYQQGNEITELNGYLVPTIKSKSFSTEACLDRFRTYSRTSDMAPDTSTSTGWCKTQTADWRLGIKCRLQTRDVLSIYRRCYFHCRILTGNRVIQLG